MVIKMFILSIQTDIQDFFEPLLDAFANTWDMIKHFFLKFMDAETLNILFYALIVLAVMLILMAVINKND